LVSLLNVKRVRWDWCWFGKRLRRAFGKLGTRSFLKERKWRPLKLWTQLNIGHLIGLELGSMLVFIYNMNGINTP
jgi:hypothetical protein